MATVHGVTVRGAGCADEVRPLRSLSKEKFVILPEIVKRRLFSRRPPSRIVEKIFAVGRVGGL